MKASTNKRIVVYEITKLAAVAAVIGGASACDDPWPCRCFPPGAGLRP